jgi:hypothetical protein
VLRQDLDDNAMLYGSRLENREIVTTPLPARQPRDCDPLNKYSPLEGTSTGSSQ